MIYLKGEVVINRSVETVFDFIADVRNEPRYNPHILQAEKTSDGPVGPGTRFRNETRSMGKTTPWLIEITSYERPRKLTLLLHSSAMDIQGTLQFYSLDFGTRIHWSWDMDTRGFFRLITPWIRRWGQRLEERNWENLKHFLESRKELPD